MKEAIRYLNNGKVILKKSPIEDGRHKYEKYATTACGIAYLAVARAIDDYLLQKGFAKKELPKSAEAYRKALQKHLSVYNAKLIR